MRGVGTKVLQHVGDVGEGAGAYGPGYRLGALERRIDYRYNGDVVSSRQRSKVGAGDEPGADNDDLSLGQVMLPGRNEPLNNMNL